MTRYSCDRKYFNDLKTTYHYRFFRFNILSWYWDKSREGTKGTLTPLIQFLSILFTILIIFT